MSNISKLLDKYQGIPDERFFKELFEKQEYEPALKEKADVVLDVGALAGEFCAYIYPNAKIIYALEPDTDSFKELEDNILEFSLDKIKPFKLALDGKNGFGFLFQKDRGGHALSDRGDKVAVKTLATFMKDEGIDHVDILKIDIEGGEDAVFKAPDFEEVASKINYIIGEHLAGVSVILKNLGFIQEDRFKDNFIFRRKK